MKANTDKSGKPGGKARLVLAYVAMTAVLMLQGCIVTQSTDTPVDPFKHTEPKTRTAYWCYVPSTYSEDRAWPLVVTLHGTHGLDSAGKQIDEWRSLAEEKNLIVVAPNLKSVQGTLPVIFNNWWLSDLESDEKDVLAVIDEVCAKYRIAQNAILLTGFSAGGYPMYFIGLRNTQRFNMLIARNANSDDLIFKQVTVTDEARKIPVAIFWGKSDFSSISEESWAAFKWLRWNGFKNVTRKKIEGGHLRRPDVAYGMWAPHLPAQYRIAPQEK